MIINEKFFDNYVDKSYINAIKAETSLESLNNLLCTLGYFNTKNEKLYYEYKDLESKIMRIRSLIETFKFD